MRKKMELELRVLLQLLYSEVLTYAPLKTPPKSEVVKKKKKKRKDRAHFQPVMHSCMHTVC